MHQYNFPSFSLSPGQKRRLIQKRLDKRTQVASKRYREHLTENALATNNRVFDINYRACSEYRISEATRTTEGVTVKESLSFVSADVPKVFDFFSASRLR